MNFKKTLATGAVSALLIAALAIPASAHGGGHHGTRRSSTTAYPVCTLADCTQTGRHTHSGTTYCGSGNCSTNGSCYGHGGGRC